MFSPTPTRKFNIDEKAPLLGLDYFFCLAADLYVVHNVAYFFLLKIGRNSSLTTLAYCKCSAKLELCATPGINIIRILLEYFSRLAMVLLLHQLMFANIMPSYIVDICKTPYLYHV